MCVSLSSLTNGLEVESHQLTAGVPEELRVVVGWIHSGTFRIDPAQLQFVVPEQSWLRIFSDHVQTVLLRPTPVTFLNKVTKCFTEREKRETTAGESSTDEEQETEETKSLFKEFMIAFLQKKVLGRRFNRS